MASYAGDNGSGFTTSTSAPFTQTVVMSGTSTAVSASVQSAVYGQPVTFTATVTAPSPSSAIPNAGTVTFYYGNGASAVFIGTANVNPSGVATFTSSTLAPSAGKPITAVFSGTSNLATSTGILNNFVVFTAQTSTKLTTNNPSTVYGQPITFTATVTPTAPSTGIPTGTVTFFFDNSQTGTAVAVNASGNAVLTTTTLGSGNHTVTATYNGDGKYSASNASQISQTVNPTGTSIALAGPTSSTVYGQATLFTATVTPTTAGAGTPTGPVTFFVDNNATGIPVTLNASGQAVLSLTTLNVGNHTVRASYAGNSNFGPSGPTVAVNATVTKDSSTTSVVSNVNPSAVGQTVTFTISALAQAPGSGTPTGTVSIFVDNAVQGSPVTLNSAGQAIITISNLSQGTHTISASYSGDSNFSASGPGSPLGQLVAAFGSSTSIAPSSVTTVYGQSATFTATVTSPGGVPTGTVRFIVDGVTQSTLVNVNGQGQAFFSTGALSTGQHSISAIYTGNATYGSSTASSPATLTVNRASSSVSVTGTATAAPYGTPIGFTATVTRGTVGNGAPTGTVTFVVDGVPQSTPVALNAQGQAGITLNNLGAGNHSVSAIYNGDTNFNGSTSSNAAGVQILATTVTTVTSASSTTVYGQTMTFTARITTPATGTIPPATGYLFFFINGNYAGFSQLNNATPNQGTLTINAGTFGAPLQAGSYTVTAFYNGDSNYTISPASAAITQTIAKANDTVTLTSSANPTAFGQAFTLTASAQPVAPGSGYFSGPMYFYINGTYFASSNANSSGVAILTVTSSTFGGALPSGNYTFTAVYGGDKNFTQSPVSASLTQSVQPQIGYLYAQLMAQSGVSVGSTFGIQVVAATSANNFASTYNAPASVVILSGPAGAQLSGNTTVNFVNGVANFTGLGVNISGSYTLEITSGLVKVDLSFVTSGRVS